MATTLVPSPDAQPSWSKIVAVGGARHPSIPLPADLFGAGRRNSDGIDLADPAVLDDIAATVVHLAGPGGRFITGAAIAVDGGFAA